MITNLPPLAAEFDKVIDAHTHLGIQWPEEAVYIDTAESIAMMDRFGIHKAITSTSRFLRFDTHAGNVLSASIRDQYPNRIACYCILDPVRTQDSLRELNTWVRQEGFIGVKIHCSHNQIPYNHSLYLPLYEEIALNPVPILAHAFSVFEVRTLLDAAKQFPSIPFIVGHSGGFEWAQCMHDIAQQPNAYADLTCSCVDNGRVEKLVEVVGADRVVLGTDLPFMSPATQVSPIIHASLSSEDKAKILGGTINRLVGGML